MLSDYVFELYVRVDQGGRLIILVLDMMYNISPDTYLGKFGASYKITEDATIQLIDPPIGWDDTTITANGCMYRKDKQGFMPALMESKFKDRAIFQKKIIEFLLKNGIS